MASKRRTKANKTEAKGRKSKTAKGRTKRIVYFKANGIVPPNTVVTNYGPGGGGAASSSGGGGSGGGGTYIPPTVPAYAPPASGGAPSAGVQLRTMIKEELKELHDALKNAQTAGVGDVSQEFAELRRQVDMALQTSSQQTQVGVIRALQGAQGQISQGFGDTRASIEALRQAVDTTNSAIGSMQHRQAAMERQVSGTRQDLMNQLDMLDQYLGARDGAQSATIEVVQQQLRDHGRVYEDSMQALRDMTSGLDSQTQGIVRNIEALAQHVDSRVMDLGNHVTAIGQAIAEYGDGNMERLLSSIPRGEAAPIDQLGQTTTNLQAAQPQVFPMETSEDVNQGAGGLAMLADVASTQPPLPDNLGMLADVASQARPVNLIAHHHNQQVWARGPNGEPFGVPSFGMTTPDDRAAQALMTMSRQDIPATVSDDDLAAQALMGLSQQN